MTADPAEGETVTLRVPETASGSRLDRFLADALGHKSRSSLRRMIVEGRVSVDGRTASKPGLAMNGGTTVELNLPAPPRSQLRGESIPLDIVHEDDHLLVLNKPAGLIVHPGHGCRDGTLVNALVGRGTTLSSTGAPDRPGIVHRLDRGTSGLLVVAKTDTTHQALSDAFSRREIEKRYLALVWGHPDPPAATIDRGIGRSRVNRLKMSVVARRSRRAVTHFETSESMTGFAVLDVRPETGRTHQIRVHLQSIRHAIVGDDRYGGRPWRGVQDPKKRKALREFDRLGLHACGLAFDHPATGRRLRFDSSPSQDYQALLRVLRQS